MCDCSHFSKLLNRIIFFTLHSLLTHHFWDTAKWFVAGDMARVVLWHMNDDNVVEHQRWRFDGEDEIVARFANQACAAGVRVQALLGLRERERECVCVCLRERERERESCSET